MAIETPLWLDPAPGQEAGPATSARADRALIELLATEGVENVQRGDLAVTSRTSGAAMSVEVAPGVGYVTGDDVARQGRYRVVVTATETKAVAGAPATGSRVDLVVLRVWDASVVGGANHRWDVEVVTGVAGDSPSAPAAPPTALVLARVRVAAGQASVQAGDITDVREQSGANTLRVGTAAIPGTTAERGTYTNPLAGQLWENTTTGLLEHYAGGRWAPVVADQVVVQTSYAYEAITASGVVTYTVPLGAALREARVAFPGSLYTGGLAFVTRSAAAATGIGTTRYGANGATVEATPRFLVNGWNNGTTEKITDVWLSGTTLVVATQREYSSSYPEAAGTQQLTIVGRP